LSDTHPSRLFIRFIPAVEESLVSKSEDEEMIEISSWWLPIEIKIDKLFFLRPNPLHQWKKDLQGVILITVDMIRFL
jgi:hypothetical protein